MESPVFLPSLALSLLYLTVLSFGPTMVTYLLHTSFTPLQVSAMLVGAVAAELSGTWAAPLLMSRIGPIRSGLWFLNWQLGCLAAAVVAFAWFDSQSLVVAASLIIGVALSRTGLWGFDLSVQYLVQEVRNPLPCQISQCSSQARTSRNILERGSPPQKWPYRILQSFSLSQQPLLSPVLKIFGIRCSSASGLSPWPLCALRRMCARSGVTCCTCRGVWTSELFLRSKFLTLDRTKDRKIRKKLSVV